MPPILATCPGKLGDLIYCLPTARALAAHAGRPLHLATSALCAPAQGLLAAQPYVERAFIDQNWQLQEIGLGYQPWRMAEPPEYQAVYHLGLRPDWARGRVFGQHLMETFLQNACHAYGLELGLDLGARFLFLPPAPGEDFIALHAWGQSLALAGGAGLLPLALDYWGRLLDSVGLPVKGILGPGEEDIYAPLGIQSERPRDLLELAETIDSARLFLGVESAPNALAQGLSAPRLVLDYFGNALPQGPGGRSFRLDEPLEAVRARLHKLLGG